MADSVIKFRWRDLKLGLVSHRGHWSSGSRRGRINMTWPGTCHLSVLAIVERILITDLDCRFRSLCYIIFPAGPVGGDRYLSEALDRFLAVES